jgi:hypothetical protein
MLPQPGLSDGLDIGVERILAKGVLLPSLSKERLAGGIVAGQGACTLKGLGLTYQPDARPRFPQAGIVDLPRRLQACQEDPFLGRGHPQRRFAHKRWGASRSRGRWSGGSWIGWRTNRRRHQRNTPWEQNVCSYNQSTMANTLMQAGGRSEARLPRLEEQRQQGRGLVLSPPVARGSVQRSNPTQTPLSHRVSQTAPAVSPQSAGRAPGLAARARAIHPWFEIRGFLARSL